MAINLETLLSWEFPVMEQSYDERDAILYALGIGLGADPTNPEQLRYLYEEQLVVFPTMSLVLGHPGPWFRDPRLGIDWVHVLHGEQELRIHQPLRPSDQVTCHTKVTDVIDKGPGRGALIYWSRTLTRTATGEPLSTMSSTLVCRNDGGFGGPSRPSPPRPTVPDGDPPLRCDLATSPRAGLIYRLSGDRNPLHIDPAVARAAGFDRPILHGLCTLGVAAHALLRTCLDYRSERLAGIRLRFAAPVYPGETVRTEIWPGEGTLAFRCRSLERDVVVIDGGSAEVAAADAAGGGASAGERLGAQA